MKVLPVKGAAPRPEGKRLGDLAIEAGFAPHRCGDLLQSLGWARLEPDSKWVLEGGAHYIRANQPTASLTLPSPVPADRTVEIVLWCAERAAGGAQAVTIRLNGFSLGEHPLASEPTTLKLETPRSLAINL